MAFEREAAIGNLEYAKRWKDRPTDETIDMAIKALKQEPKFIVKSDGTIEQIKNCDDCIFREEWEKIGKLLSVILKKQTEQEPCEDAISRQAALKELKESAEHHANDCREEALLRRDRDIIRALPPITPQPKTDVLDKIRAEIHATAEMHEDGDYYLRDEWIDEIIDKYKAESEEGRE